MVFPDPEKPARPTLSCGRIDIDLLSKLLSLLRKRKVTFLNSIDGDSTYKFFAPGLSLIEYSSSKLML